MKHSYIKSVLQNSDIESKDAAASANRLASYSTAYKLARRSQGGGCGQGCSQASGASCGQSSQRSGK